MDNQLLRLVVVTILVLLITSDMKDLLQALSTSASMGPLVNWSNRRDKQAGAGSPPKHSRQGRSADKPSAHGQFEEDVPLQFYTPIPTGRSGKVRSMAGTNSEDSNKMNLSQKDGKRTPKSIIDTLTEEERSELVALKSHLTKVMQEWCLPKLVCELHATAGERDSFSEAEQGLLSIIKETSMNPMGEVISRYHFAAHMGQLLADVEGNGCHNFYPNCPLSGSKVLQMVKKVRIR